MLSLLRDDRIMIVFTVFFVVLYLHLNYIVANQQSFRFATDQKKTRTQANSKKICKPDELVTVTHQQATGLEGLVLLASELQMFKQGKLYNSWKKQEEALISKSKLTGKQQRELKRLQHGLTYFNDMQESIWWHQTFLTTGLRHDVRKNQLTYPFLPHMFSLWDLAPKKGAGVTLVLIDTGVAAFSVEGNKSYKKHIDLETVYEWPDNYTVVGRSGRNPLYYIMGLLEAAAHKPTFVYAKVEQELAQAVLVYLESGSKERLENLVLSVGNQKIVNKGSLTHEGKKLLEQIINGPYGITPEGKRYRSAFEVGTIVQPKRQRVLLNFLPAATVGNATESLIAGHGSHAYGIVAGRCEHYIGVCGIAPQAHTVMIKAFSDNGTTKKSILINALDKAAEYKADIVNLSLKIADALDLDDLATRHLERQLKEFDFVVCASGNDGDPTSQKFHGNYQAYPARFTSMYWTVGAFGCIQGSCTVPDFSQYEPTRGPSFLAPGVNILSSALPSSNRDESQYIFMSGTSMAAPQVSAFLALVRAEFGDQFNSEQIYEVCKHASVRLHATANWQEKALYGVLDMRTALFILHVLLVVRHGLSQIKMSFDYSQQFLKLLHLTSNTVFKQVQKYGQAALSNSSFKNQAMDYIAQAQRKKEKFNFEDFYPFTLSVTLKQAIQHIADQVIDAYSEKQI